MQIRKIFLLAGITGMLILTGCGGAATADKDPLPAEQDEGEESADGPFYEDNFAVDSAAASEFSSRLKAAVAEKDLKALADLTAYPVYVGLPDTDGIAEAEDDFLRLDSEQVFTEELQDSIASAEETALTPSEAGFVLAGENGRPNIVFGVVDGELEVTGINY